MYAISFTKSTLRFVSDKDESGNINIIKCVLF